MFTGIIETVGTLTGIETSGSNIHFEIESSLASELKIDQSVAHNGVCLTIVKIDGNKHVVTAIDETIQKTNAGNWKIGNAINLERCLPFNGRIDGHLVQGHVDSTGVCVDIQAQTGSWLYTFSFDEQFAPLMIEKGSICVNGTSLTAFNVGRTQFTVAIIPYTYEHTNIHEVKVGDKINLEFDVIGKYLDRFRTLQLS